MGRGTCLLKIDTYLIKEVWAFMRRGRYRSKLHPGVNGYVICQGATYLAASCNKDRCNNVGVPVALQHDGHVCIRNHPYYYHNYMYINRIMSSSQAFDIWSGQSKQKQKRQQE